MTVTVLLFSVLREIAGTESLSLSLPTEATLGDAAGAVIAQFPRMADWDSRLLLAVNSEYANRDTALHDGDEVALMPPVQGG